LMAASTGTRELVPRIMAARGDMGARDREWLDRTLAAMGG
jgi:hypothetical protein